MNVGKNTWMALITFVAGVCATLLGLGVIPSDESNFHAPHWVVTAAGFAFMFTGVAIAFGADRRRAQLSGMQGVVVDIACIVIMGSLGMIATWVGFGPGERNFHGGVPFVSAEANALFGRVMFGGGALICWLAEGAMIVAMLRRWRKAVA